MISSSRPAPVPLLGSLGTLVLFLWGIALVVLTPLTGTWFPAASGVLVLGLIHPRGFQRLLHPRWLILLVTLFALNLFFGGGEKDALLLGISYSSANLLTGFQMVLGALVILLAADLLSASVEITELAGLLERLGMHGLGFSIGVAANLLPNLNQSSRDAWHSLRMRGGLRASWLRGLQLLLITILANAIRHSEEIVLAAEARAFDPDKSQRLAFRVGSLDWWLIPIGVLTLAGFILLT